MAQLYLLLLILLIVISECRDIAPVTETVFASKEEDVALPCFDSRVMDQKSCYRVRLIKYATKASQMKVLLAWPKTSKFQDAPRVKWEADENGRKSLLLTKSQASDVGLFGCEIWQGWDCILVKNISLKVRECKTLQAVKAAPSTPVELKCPVDVTSGQQGPQNISWAMLKVGNPVSVNSERADMNGSTLAIQSVKYSDSGWYRCAYRLGLTQRCFDLNLLVQGKILKRLSLTTNGNMHNSYVPFPFYKVENVVTTTAVPGIDTHFFFNLNQLHQSFPVESCVVIVETCFLDSPGLITKKWSSGAFVAVVVSSVLVGIVVIAAVTGLIVYRRRHTQTQKHTAGINLDVYEALELSPSADCPLYHMPDESLCTFQYK